MYGNLCADDRIGAAPGDPRPKLTVEEIAAKRALPVEDVRAVLAHNAAACAAEHTRKEARAQIDQRPDDRIIDYGNGTYGVRASEKDRSWT